MYGEQFEEREGMPGFFLGDFHGRTVPPPMRKVFSFERIGDDGLRVYWKEARDKGPAGQENFSGALALRDFCERHSVDPEEMMKRLERYAPDMAEALRRVVEAEPGYEKPGSLSRLLDVEARREMLEWARTMPEFRERVDDLTGEDMEAVDRVIDRAKFRGK